MNWTNDRIRELEALHGLLSRVAGLNRSSDFLGNVQYCIEEAERLKEWGECGTRPSFPVFLQRLAYAAPSDTNEIERLHAALAEMREIARDAADPSSAYQLKALRECTADAEAALPVAPAPAARVDAERLTPFDAVARAMDMASLLAGAVAQSNVAKADACAARLRSHLIEYMDPRDTAIDAALAADAGRAKTMTTGYAQLVDPPKPAGLDWDDAGRS